MTIVTIYKITCATVTDDPIQGFNLEKWGANGGFLAGRDDGGKSYVLPDGYTLKKTGIFDPDNLHCDLYIHETDMPELISVSRTAVLRHV